VAVSHLTCNRERSVGAMGDIQPAFLIVHNKSNLVIFRQSYKLAKTIQNNSPFIFQSFDGVSHHEPSFLFQNHVPKRVEVDRRKTKKGRK